jgi:hypothetical protein
VVVADGAALPVTVGAGADVSHPVAANAAASFRNVRRSIEAV